jgi:hypothetical protein
MARAEEEGPIRPADKVIKHRAALCRLLGPSRHRLKNSCPQCARFCCKTILSGPARNIDSRPSAKAQCWFKYYLGSIRILRVNCSSSSGAAQARRTSGEDAAATRNRRASLRHNQSPDECYPLLNENLTACRLRDGAARAGLQSDTRHEHHGCPAADGSDQSIASPKTRPSSGALPKLRTRKRFDTAKTQSGIGGVSKQALPRKAI